MYIQPFVYFLRNVKGNEYIQKNYGKWETSKTFGLISS